jgi:hypothetical protein
VGSVLEDMDVRYSVALRYHPLAARRAQQKDSDSVSVRCMEILVLLNIQNMRFI